MFLYLGSDHAGYKLKEKVKAYLDKQGKKYVDLGCFSEDSVDYPDMAREVVEKVLDKQPGNLGILVCGTGIGMSMAANKVKGIRAGACTTPMMAEFTRRHNKANVLCLGARVIEAKTAIAILKKFLESRFDGGRHVRRVEKIEAMGGK